MDIIVGTAGHIDHGKTALVKALTGTDTDRLPEEKKRGITIDLGFAEMEHGGVHFGFVDVPGHERFVKNMLAGASGIDIVLLVIAADEGVMPQTREHFDICRLLGVSSGIVVLTKRDLVDEEMLDLVRLDAAELVAGSFLENAPVIAVSAKSGEGISELKNELVVCAKDGDKATPLADAAAGTPESVPAPNRVPVLPIDRVFSKKGFGTVVTGTLISGTITEGDELDLLPLGRILRVRGLQTHGNAVATAHAGQRTAVNLAGIDRDEIERGMQLAEKDVLRTTVAVDAKIDVLKDAKRGLKSRQRVRVHIGAAEVLARLSILNSEGEIDTGENDLAQLRFESPIACVFGERFVIRSYSPQMTIAGGVILDPFAERHRRKEFDETRVFLENVESAGNDADKLIEYFTLRGGENGLPESELRAITGWTLEQTRLAISKNVRNIDDIDGLLISTHSLHAISSRIVAAVEAFHSSQPLLPGIGREQLREQTTNNVLEPIFRRALALLENEKRIAIQHDIVRSAAFSTSLAPDEEGFKTRLLSIYRAAELEVPKLDDAIADAVKAANLPAAKAKGILNLLINSKELVKVTDEFYFTSATINKLTEKIRTSAENATDRFIDVAKFKELAGVSRKYAIPLLEYFDREKVTVRRGDKRYIV